MKKLNLTINDAILSVGVLAFLILFALIYGLVTGDWKNAKEISSILINLIVAIGTVSAVIVALTHREKDELNKKADLLRKKIGKDHDQCIRIRGRVEVYGPRGVLKGSNALFKFISIIINDHDGAFYQYDLSVICFFYEKVNNYMKEAFVLKNTYKDEITSKAIAENFLTYIDDLKDIELSDFEASISCSNIHWVDSDKSKVINLKNDIDQAYKTILKILEK